MTGACDRCGRSIPEGGGYLFYASGGLASSGASTPGVQLRTMFLCDACADDLMTPAAFDRCRKARGKQIELTGGFEAIQRAIRLGADIGIVERCDALELSPVQGKAKARELAVRLWQDQSAGRPEAEAFWTSKPEKYKAQRGNGRWWQIWKRRA